MRSKIYILLCLIPCLAFSPIMDRDISDIYEEIPTGIILDSMNNEVLLVTEAGKPIHYTSHIFTPVCNTGECLPVFININWDLNGNFKSFNFDEGEILTKLDHVPFTAEDYKLLDEILRGPDPRFLDVSNHPGNPSPGGVGQGDVSQGSPAPQKESKIFKTKYEMVDGISGATLPEQRAKFVPGALYTCYTLWGLSNDHHAKMAKYTVDNLLHENVQYFLERSDLNCQDFVLDELAKERTGDNARISVMMEILDTTDGLANVAILNRVYYYHLVLNLVKTSLEQKFYAPTSALDPDNLVKEHILYLWAYNEIDDHTLGRLTTTLHKSGNLFTPSLAVFQNHPIWPDGVVDELLQQVVMLKEEALRKQLFAVIVGNKEYISKEDWEHVKRVKKKYAL